MMEDRSELIRGLFALLTARFEDGAGIAADGQGAAVAPEVQSDLALRLQSIANEIAILADAVVAIVLPDGDG